MTRRGRIEAALVLAAAGAIALSAPASEPGPAVRPLLTASATGHLKMQNSRRGDPIVRIRNAAPGDVVRGRVTLNHTGTRRVVKTFLSADRVADVAGPNGGELSRTLRVRVVRLRWRGHGRRLRYRGRLMGLKGPRVGTWLRPGKPRTYSVRVRMPDHGKPPGLNRGDNAYQGSRVSFRLRWRIRERG